MYVCRDDKFARSSLRDTVAPDSKCRTGRAGIRRERHEQLAPTADGDGVSYPEKPTCYLATNQAFAPRIV